MKSKSHTRIARLISFVTILLILVSSLFSTASVAFASSSVSERCVEAATRGILATYWDENFYSLSTPKNVTTSSSCNSFTFRAVCSSGTDTITVVVNDVTPGRIIKYNKTIDFVANGTSQTKSIYFPSGTYQVYFIGSNKLHTQGAVNFNS